MEPQDLPAGSRSGLLSSLLELGKPRLSMLVIFTAGLGVAVAPGSLSVWRVALFLAATSLLVFAANTLNCVAEREIDAKMARTRERPLPDGRIGAPLATAAGWIEAVVATVGLLIATQWTTTILGLVAFASYVFIYTPMKRHSSLALYVGGVPGAIPPLMGWTAVTGELGWGGWALFALLFAWQLPHFIAIALMHRADYTRGGLQVLTVAHGERSARRQLVATTLLLVAVSLAPWFLELGGALYLLAALAAGFAFLFHSVRALGAGTDARPAFRFSLLYLPLVASALVLDRLLPW